MTDTQDYSLPEMLDCGHLNWFCVSERARDGYSGGTGYGMTPGTRRRLCYQCCADRERAHMIETGEAVLYFCLKPHRVTDWGGRLEFPAFNITHSNGRAGRYPYQITSGRFRGPDGKLWAFRNQGDQQLARCKRLKDQR